MIVSYTGAADARTVKAADFSAAGITQADLTFNKANSFQISVATNVAAFLLANSSEFHNLSTADTFGTLVGGAGQLAPGTWVSRPDPTLLAPGTTRQMTDINLGQQYIVAAGTPNAWVPAGAGVGQVGGIEIVGAHPAAGPTAGIYPTISPATTTSGIGTHLVISQLTPASFVMPARQVQVVFHLPAALLSTRAATYTIGMDFTRDAGANWHQFCAVPWAVPSSGVLNAVPIIGYLPTGSATAGRIVGLSDTVQVRVWIIMTPTRNFTDGVTNGTTTFASATGAFSAANDVGKLFVGGTLDGRTISSVTDSTHVVFSGGTIGAASSISTGISDTFKLVCGDDFLGAPEGNYWAYTLVESC